MSDKDRLGPLEEKAKYSTGEQRERMLIDLLDLKINGFKEKYCDKIRQDQITDNSGLKVRHCHWRLGKTELLVSYHEVKGVPGSAVFRLRHQPISETGRVEDNWEDIKTFGEFEALIRQANRLKGYSSGDVKAQRNAHKHDGAKPDGIIIEGLTGSHAYGLTHDGYTDPDSHEWVKPSDIDIRGCFVTPTKNVLKLNESKEFVKVPGEDESYDELGRFLYQCAKCSPERLEMLSTEPRFISTEGQLIRDNQQMFLSKMIKGSYGGYAQQQLARIERNVDRKTKPAMHLIRLMITGIRIMKHGVVNCDMRDYRQEMLAIRMGNMPLPEVFDWHRRLEVEFAKAAANTKLPDKPDWDRINDILIQIRYNHL